MSSVVAVNVPEGHSADGLILNKPGEHSGTCEMCRIRCGTRLNGRVS
jgi:hypothetical protein